MAWGFWNKIKNGFKKVGKFIGKVAKKVWNGVKTVGKGIVKAAPKILKVASKLPLEQLPGKAGMIGAGVKAVGSII